MRTLATDKDVVTTCPCCKQPLVVTIGMNVQRVWRGVKADAFIRKVRSAFPQQED